MIWSRYYCTVAKNRTRNEANPKGIVMFIATIIAMFKRQEQATTTATTDTNKGVYVDRMRSGSAVVKFGEYGTFMSITYYNESGNVIKLVDYYANGTPAVVEHYNGEQIIKTEYFAEDGRPSLVEHFAGEVIVRTEHYGLNGEITIE